MPQTIKIKCKGSGTAAIDSLKVIQGELKSLSDENKAKLRTRIETLGFDAPIFVWRGHVLDGTQRLRVLEEMVADGWVLPKGQVPVCEIAAKNLTEAKERLLGYVSQYGKIDQEGFVAFTEGLDLDFGTLDLPDFDLEGLMASMEPEPERGCGEDEIPEPPKKAITKPGDLWLLGEHRLLCGDATKAEDVERVIVNKIVCLVLTSPPYPGVAMWNEGEEDGLTDNIDRLRELCRDVFSVCARTADVICWNVADVPIGGQTVQWNSSDVLKWAVENNALVRPIVWDKGIPNPLPPLAFRRKPVVPHITHEWMFVIYPHGWNPREKQSTLGGDSEWQMRSVWSIAPAKATEIGHKAPFPVLLAERCISIFSLESDDVFDPFLGSGTTLIAAEKLNRKCYGLEIEPRYCDVTVERWETFTGQKATRQKAPK